MADDSFQEKTEQATPKKLKEARDKGNVAKSPEFNSVFILLAGLLSLLFMSESFLQDLHNGFKIFYRELGTTEVNLNNIQALATTGIGFFVRLIAPFMITIVVVGIGVNVAQVGFLFTLKPLVPNFQKLNPIAGLKKFFTMKSWVELLKGLIKLTIVGGVAYWTLMQQKDRYLYLVYEDVGGILKFIATMLFQIAMRTSAALLGLALLDLVYQRWQYKKDLKMSTQEVKEETKQAEGDPLVKSTIRSLQQTRSRERMMDNVQEADVVVTNPVHLAVALKYDPEEVGAPVVVAKGVRLLAERIKEIAREHGIPVIENKPLAQSLYKLAVIGKEIPMELFQVVAEVFANVYQMRNRMN